MTAIAQVPPMGWNSWDCYGTSVTEQEVMANATFMAEHLLEFGWDTVVVDIAWYDPDARAGGYNDDAAVVLDAHGRQLPAPNRFPSAADGRGFGPLAEAVHALGLKFGLHIMRGIPRKAVAARTPVLGTSWTADEIADRDNVCSWNPDNLGLDQDHPGAQAYYDSQVAQFARWGVDFIKADDMLSPYQDAEIAAYARAIARSGRQIVLSLSPGTRLSLAHLEHLRSTAQLWRVSDDLWDRWQDVLDQFARLARWAPHQRPGAWADADMIPIGRISLRGERGEPRLSALDDDEQRTLLTLWCMARSPLMLGADLPTTPRRTIELLRNRSVLELLRYTSSNTEILREGDLAVWTARDVRDDRIYAAVFWTGSEPTRVEVAVSDLGCTCPLHLAATDLWSGAVVESLAGVLSLEIPRHGVRLLQLPATATA